MQLPSDFATYTQWSAIATVFFFLLTVLAFILQWGFRFRLVGVTAFMGVVTCGIFALGLALFTPTQIPGAVRYTRVYDNGATEAVIVVPPTVTVSEIEATLRQAANNLFSYGRAGYASERLNIRIRTLIHPEPGVTEPLYLGKIQRALGSREDNQMTVELFEENIAKLKQSRNDG